MHLLYCDETNLEERTGDFLIYGGLLIPSGQAQQLSKAIEDVRNKHNVPRDYKLKFNPGPDGFSHAQFIALKEEVLGIAKANGARLIVYVVLHNIATNPDEARRNGINTVCYHFNCIMNQTGGCGLVLVDRFTDADNAIDAHLRDKFTIGLKGMPFTPEMRLTNIVGFHYSAIGQSHFPSLIDVALGSLRFAINAHTRAKDEHLATAQALLRLLAPLMWRVTDEQPVPEIGFMFSPKAIRSVNYRDKYQRLKNFLAASGIDTEQSITDEKPH